MRTRPYKRNPETLLVNQILAYLLHGVAKAGKVKTMGVVREGRYCADQYLFHGHPDIEAFVDIGNGSRCLLYIEVKVGNNKQSDAQCEFEQMCRSAGVLYIVAYSLDDVIKAVETIKNGIV